MERGNESDVDSLADDISNLGNEDSPRDIPRGNRDIPRSGVIMRRDWLELPSCYMRPLKMCAVNQFVHCVDKLDSRFLSTGPEYVLVGSGTSMPDHFHWWIYCMHQVNRVQNITGCVVPVTDTTRLVKVSKSGKSKAYDVTGIERKVVHYGPVEPVMQEDWIQTTSEHKTFTTKCLEYAADPDNTTYARINLVEMHWGLIPVEYMENEVLQRRVFHVLRTVPAPGLNLRRLIQEKFFEQRNSSNKRNIVMITEVCDLLERAVNYEADNNLRKGCMWGGPLPNAWTLKDPSSVTSVERLLSPFILPKLLNNLKGGYRGSSKVGDGLDQSTLVVSGYPDLRTPEAAQAALDFYDQREASYLADVKKQELDFMVGLAKCADSPDEEVTLEPILSHEGRNLNCLSTDLDMVFYLKDFMAFAREGLYREAEKLTMPKLVMAVVDLFQFSTLDTNMRNYSKDNFIRAHVGEFNEVVTETSVHTKYKVTDVQSLGDFPRAGMFGDRRKAYKLNANQIRDSDIVTEDMLQLYHDYMRLQLTTTWNGLEMDAWMSDRVHRCAQCVRRLSTEICDRVSDALLWAADETSIEAGHTIQLMLHDEVSNTWCRINSALVRMNRTTKANPLNLSMVWGLLCSDVLTHLGMHNDSWRWVMYPILVAPGMGHLRAQSEDGHAARVNCVLLAKPNAVGLDEVVLKIMTWCLTMVDQVIPDLSPEAMQSMRMVKVDRMTRASMEEWSAVLMADGRIYNQPTSTDFMKALYFDEGNRQLDEAALQGLVTTALPRDSMAGEGATYKSQESKTRGPREKGCNQQLPGMGLYLLLMASNTNPKTAAVAEAMQTLMRGAMTLFPPGAQQSVGLLKLLERELKRKRGTESSSVMTTGDPMLPTDPSERKHLSYLFCILMIVSRHIGLINKTGQSNWELSMPVREYIDMFKVKYFSNFQWSISNALDASNDRIVKGFVARAVSSCLICTVACQCEQFASLKEACFQTLMCMESSALTLYWANMALLNGISHLSDAGLCFVNQIIRFRAKTPVLSVEFLCEILDPENTLDRGSAEFIELRTYLESLRDLYVPGGFTGSYFSVEGVGSNGDYAQFEHYLQKYCSINHGSDYTYRHMIRDAATKIVDLTDFLDLPESMTDARILFHRCGVRYDSAWYNTPGDRQQSGNRYLIIVPDPADRAGTTTVGRVWVHVLQHLFVSALIGRRELHGDNPFELGKSIFKLMVKKLVPQQAIPSCSLLCETFQFRFGEVSEDIFPVISTREYFQRNRKCFSAWRKGVIGQMASVLGAHPLEDVIHIHAWIQMHILHCGKQPQKFYYMPGMVPRGAELVPGRIYPLLGHDVSEGEVLRDHSKGDGELGIICVCPEGLSYALLQLSNGDAFALPLDRWQQDLQIRRMIVGPLIFRKHAVLRLPDAGLGIVQEQDGIVGRALLLDGWEHRFDTRIHDVQRRNFLDCLGYYSVLCQDGLVSMSWQQVHEYLLPLGTHVAVLKVNLLGRRFPPGIETYVSGWLRYPEEYDEGGGANDRVYIAFRIAERAQDFDDIVILPMCMRLCMTIDDALIDDVVDFILP